MQITEVFYLFLSWFFFVCFLEGREIFIESANRLNREDTESLTKYSSTK